MQRYQIHDFLAMASKSCSLDVFECLGLQGMITAALDRTAAWEKKKCALRSPLIMTLVLSMSLHRLLSIYDVFKGIVAGLRFSRGNRRIPLEAVTEWAVYKARCRVGVAPVKALFEMTAAQVDAKPWFHGLRTFAVDGFSLTMPDTEENEAAFGRPKCPNGEAAYPQIKGVALVDTESRGMCAAAFGPYYMAEQPCAERFVDYLGPRDLLVIDRGLPSFALFSKCKVKQAHFLARISSNWNPEIVKEVGPGDYLAKIRDLVPADPATCRQKNQTRVMVTMIVRMVSYTFETTGETIRLLTDLLEPDEFGALELASLYHERWEIELVYDEIKTHLEAPLQGVAKTVLRSQTPVGVEQEAYAMLTVYNLIRSLMSKAARRVRIDPDHISFVGTLNIIRHAIPFFKATPKSAHKHLSRQLLDDIAADRIDRPRRKRQCPRCVRTPLSKFPRKRAKHRERYFDCGDEIRLVDRAHWCFAA